MRPPKPDSIPKPDSAPKIDSSRTGLLGELWAEALRSSPEGPPPVDEPADESEAREADLALA